MLLLFCLAVFVLNFATFFIFNYDYINGQLSKSGRRKLSKEDKNVLSKLFFIKKFKYSNKFYWVMNLINNVCVFAGIVVFIFFSKNETVCNYMLLVLIVFLLADFVLAMAGKLLIHIDESKSIFAKVFLAIILILFVIGMIIIIKTGNGDIHLNV